MTQRVNIHFFIKTLCIICLFFSFQASARTKHVLILHSYYPGYPWTDSINKGILSTLHDDGFTNDNIFFEYLDAKRHPEEKYLRNIADFISTKYSVEDIKMVIVSDNQALRFMLQWGDTIFPQVPVVFCGINALDPKLIKDKPSYTGITENIALSENIKVMQRFIPQLQKVYVIGETITITTRLILKKAKKEFAQFNTLRFEYITNFPLEDIIQKAQNFEPNSAILWLPVNKDSTGRNYSYNEVLNLLSSKSNIPIFTCWDFYMNNGTMGGILASGVKQGQEAARIATEIFNGKSPSDIPILYNHDFNKLYLDQQALERYKIRANTEDAIILNKKIDLWDKYWLEVIVVFLVLIIQMVFIVFLIITKRKKIEAEKNTKIQENILSGILNNMPNGIWLYDITADSILTFGNKRITKLEDLQPQNIFTTAKAKSIIKNIRFTNSFDQKNSETILIDDKLFGNTIIEKKIIPIFNNNEEICYLIGIADDITQRKQNETDLLVRDKMLKTLIESIEIIYKSDEVYPVLEDVIQQLALMTNISHFEINKFNKDDDADISQESVYLWDNKNIRGKTNFIINQNIILKQLYNKQAIIISKNDIRSATLPQNVAIIIIPVFVNQKLWGYAYVEDDQERQWSHTIIEVLKIVINSIGIAIELKEIVKELRASKQKAEESDRLKSAFLANMSHEIRTPLNGVIGYSNLILRPKTTSEKKKQYNKLIQKNANQLLNIIDDIIDIAGIENNQLNIYPETIAINSFLQSSRQYAENKCEEAEKPHINIIASTPLDDNEAFVYTDATRLDQIFSNLINNAIKFTQEGSIEIGYTTEDEYFIFYVKDTGIGIPEEMQDAVFERFRQVDDSMSRCYGGSGLGLAICSELIKLLGGKIWLESKENDGSSFFFKMKRCKVEADCIPEQLELEPTGLPERDWENKHILIVDDQKDIFQFLSELLSYTKVKCTYASSGFDAINSFKSSKFDLVLMDINMPDFDGIETTKALRKINSKIPIIAQTAFALKDEVRKLRKKNFDCVITKPIDTDILMDELDKVLQ